MKMNDYQGECDARSLMDAHEIKGDPKRHAKAMKHVDKLQAESSKKVAAAKAVKGLKNAFPS